MSESHVVSGLVAKRSELAGLIQHHQEALRRIGADLDHLNATIKLFDPTFDLRTIKVTAHRNANPWFKTGEAVRFVLDTLRVAETPLTSRQVCEAILKVRGINAGEIGDWPLFQKTVLAALRRQERKAMVKVAGMVKGPTGPIPAWQLV